MDAPASTVAADVAGVLAREPGVVCAYLFGSVASGRSHRESDVDVAIVLDRERHPSAADRFDVRLRLSGRLEAALRRPVDLVVLNDAPPQFGRRVLQEGRRVIVSNPDAEAAFRRQTLSRAADLEPFLRRTRRRKLDAIGR
jgi:predicted nucleotidyltransferase